MVYGSKEGGDRCGEIVYKGDANPETWTEQGGKKKKKNLGEEPD